MSYCTNLDSNLIRETTLISSFSTLKTDRERETYTTEYSGWSSYIAYWEIPLHRRKTRAKLEYEQSMST